MRAFYVFVTGAALLIILGTVSSLFYEKGDFLIWLFGRRHFWADYYFYYVTLVGEPHGFIVCGLILWLYSWKRMLTIPVLGGIVTVISYLLKQFFQHERPSIYLKRIGWDGPLSVLDYHLLGGHHSFPSGHSMAAWALFALMAAHIRKTWFSLLALFLATSVSLSRVYLVAHFLQDVVAGAMVGIVLGFTVYYGYDKWVKKSASDAHSAMSLNKSA